MNVINQNKLPFDIDSIFEIQTESEFNEIALKTFTFQWSNNTVYRGYCDLLKIKPAEISHFTNIPFLPISFFNKCLASMKI